MLYAAFHIPPNSHLYKLCNMSKLTFQTIVVLDSSHNTDNLKFQHSHIVTFRRSCHTIVSKIVKLVNSTSPQQTKLVQG